MKIFFYLFLMLSIQKGYGQSSILSSGGNASGPGGTVSFSIGQVVYTTASGTGGSLQQGVQQAFDISTSTGHEFSGISLLVKVYPNPTTSHVYLKIEDNGESIIQDLIYQLTDLNGREIYYEKITASETRLSMENLASSIYFLNVSNENNIIKSFKIIKK